MNESLKNKYLANKLLITAAALLVCLLPLSTLQAAEPSAVSEKASSAQEKPAPVYELRIYTVHPGKMPDMLARFKNHTRAIFERHGMENVGYWVPVEAKDSDKLYYILKHKSREAAAASWKAFGADPEWNKVRTESEAKGAIVKGVEATFMAATEFSALK